MDTKISTRPRAPRPGPSTAGEGPPAHRSRVDDTAAGPSRRASLGSLSGLEELRSIRAAGASGTSAGRWKSLPPIPIQAGGSMGEPSVGAIARQQGAAAPAPTKQANPFNKRLVSVQQMATALLTGASCAGKHANVESLGNGRNEELGREIEKYLVQMRDDPFGRDPRLTEGMLGELDEIAARLKTDGPVVQPRIFHETIVTPAQLDETLSAFLG